MTTKECKIFSEQIILPKILKRDGYKCKSCRINHKTRVYINSLNNYVECDEFIENWAAVNDRKVFTLCLELCHTDFDCDNFAPSNLVSLCPKCNSNRKKEFKKHNKAIYQQEICNTQTIDFTNEVQHYYVKSENKILLTNTQYLELEDKIRRADLLQKHSDNTRHIICEIIRHINTYI
jgi:hypothetical protein